MVSHTEHKPYKCFVCDYASNRKESLKVHCTKKHEMSSEEFNVKADRVFAGMRRQMGRPRKSETATSAASSSAAAAGSNVQMREMQPLPVDAEVPMPQVVEVTEQGDEDGATVTTMVIMQ